MITIIDYGMGNLGSIYSMIKKIGGEAVITADAEVIGNATKIILPGVGSFDRAMSNLDNLGLIELIQQKADSKIPLLGICLGMQLLASGSKEGVMPGLGLVPGRVKKFELPQEYKIPHMGWNTVEYDPTSVMFKGFERFEEVRFYFVHSYYYACDEEQYIKGQTHYGGAFTSVVNKDCIYGVQFHPEKSHKFGMQLLQNFIELA